jgi:hypothetical protein
MHNTKSQVTPARSFASIAALTLGAAAWPAEGAPYAYVSDVLGHGV